MLTLNIDSVELAFEGRKILQNISLDCKQGEIVGLLGRNGSGKSSLLKIIFGILEPMHKYLNIGDEVIEKGYHNNRVAYLPQNNFLPRGIRISSLARIMIDPLYWIEFADQDIYKNHHQKKPEQLSGGELRQLEMLMILYNRAGFILLDEPFTHVTPVQTNYFIPIIKRVAESKGIIITDHQYHNVMEVSDRIIILTEGCTKPVNSLNDLVTYNYISGNN